jgi:hypothetical protein
MLKHGLDRRAASYTWTVAFILLVLGVVYLIRETLFVFALALLFSYLLRPLVYHLDLRLPGRSRAPALAIVYLSLVGLLIAVGITVGSRVVLQANALAMRIPELLSRLEQPVELIVSPSLSPPSTGRGPELFKLRSQCRSCGSPGPCCCNFNMAQTLMQLVNPGSAGRLIEFDSSGFGYADLG